MLQTGGGGNNTTPLLDFDLRPVSARRHWRNVLHKQRYEATLRQHRDVTREDNLCQELTRALQRSIEQQIAQDPTLTPHSTVHFTMQSRAFTHAFQSTTFTVQEFEEGSERLTTYLQSLAAKLNSNEEFTPTTRLPWKPLSYVPQVLAVEKNDTGRVAPPCGTSSNGRA